MSNNLGQIYATSKSSEKYIILDSQNVDVSGNLILKGSLGVLDSSTNDISYGNVGSVLTSNGSGNPISWATPTTPTTPTPDFLLFGKSSAQPLTVNAWNDVLIEYAFTNSPTANNHNNIFVDNTTGIITFSNPGVYILNATFFGYWGVTSNAFVELLDIVSDQRIYFVGKEAWPSQDIVRDNLIFSGAPIIITSVDQTLKFRAGVNNGSNPVLNDSNNNLTHYNFGSIIRLI